MSRWIEIAFRGMQNNEDIHRVRNFCDELGLTFDRSGWGVLRLVEENWIPNQHLRVVAVRARTLRRAISLIENMVMKHGFNDQVTITHGSESEEN